MSRPPTPYSKIGMEAHWILFFKDNKDYYIEQLARKHSLTKSYILNQAKIFEAEWKKPLSFNKFMRYKDLEIPPRMEGEQRFTFNK